MVAAERFEFTGILERGSAWRELSWGLAFAMDGRCNGTSLTLVANGPGPRLAAGAFQTARQHCPVDAVVSTGTCGGLDPALRVGDVVIASQVVDVASGRRYASEPLKAPGKGIGHQPASAIVASQDRVAGTVQEKRALFQQGASVVEMEAAGVAARAAEDRIPFSCIRSVSDDAGEEIPIDLNLYRDAAGRFRLGAIACSALIRPFSRIPALLRLQRNATFASAKLGEFFANCCF